MYNVALISQQTRTGTDRQTTLTESSAYYRSDPNITDSEMSKLNSKLVIITGSAGGLGKAFAERLLQLGCLSSILKYYWLILPFLGQEPRFASQILMRNSGRRH